MFAKKVIIELFFYRYNYISVNIDINKINYQKNILRLFPVF